MENHRPVKSESSKILSEDIRLIMSSALELGGISQSTTLQEWMQFVEEFLDPIRDPLSDEVIQKALDKLEKIKDFRVQFPEGSRCCFTVIPCDNIGYAFDEVDVENNVHISRLVIVPPGEEEKNVIFKQYKLLNDFMPDEIRRDCTFEIGSYTEAPEEGSSFDISYGERTRIIAACAQVLKNLQYHCRQYFDGGKKD